MNKTHLNGVLIRSKCLQTVPYVAVFLLALHSMNISCAQGQDPNPPPPRIELVDTSEGHVVVHKGLQSADIRWIQKSLSELSETRKISDRFQVVLSETDATASMVTGTYYLSGDSLRFTPDEPFRKGKQYYVKAVVQDWEPVELSFSIAVRATAPTRVTQVYPTTDQIPENLHRFHVHFSAPVQQSNLAQHLRLEDSTGVPIADVFDNPKMQTWSADGLRLTLRLDEQDTSREALAQADPQRIRLKRGKSMRLVVANTLMDSNGKPLSKAYFKSFQVVQPDTRRPKPHRWKMELPEGGSMDPLIIQLDEPYDHHQLMETMRIRNWSGNGFLKSVKADAGGMTLYVYAKEPWWPGVYYLQLDATLRDLAGNIIVPPPDYSATDVKTRTAASPIVELEFEID